jgi:hypothetical protein
VNIAYESHVLTDRRNTLPRAPSSARRIRSWPSWITAALVVTLLAITVSVATILSIPLPSAPITVTADPLPADNMSIAQTFPPTKGLISDPFVLTSSNLDYMYSSGLPGAGKLHVPERSFVVMGKFLSLSDAMPHLPSWVEPDTGLWSPDVRKVGKTYVMWYSGQDRDFILPTGAPAQCIGVATSQSPTGPFTSGSPAPAICQASGHGDIDPRTFIAPNGREWLYWKNDGNAVDPQPLTTHIYAQRLASNGQTLIGSASVLLANSRPWEGDLIEAPDMVHAGHRYLLFFSGNASTSEINGIGLAVCQGPGGPCISPYSGPWLGSNVQGAGPGEETVYVQNGITWLLYTPEAIYHPFAYPRLVAARIAFTGAGMPYIADRQGMVPGVTAGADGQTGLR